MKRALKNKPKWKPRKGWKYCETIKIGSLMETQTGMRAVLLNKTTSSATVYVVSSRHGDDPYYLGKHLWALSTEVKEIK